MSPTSSVGHLELRIFCDFDVPLAEFEAGISFNIPAVNPCSLEVLFAGLFEPGIVLTKSDACYMQTQAREAPADNYTFRNFLNPWIKMRLCTQDHGMHP